MIKTIEELIKTRTQTEWPYRVDIQRSTNDKNTDDDMRAWCEKRCKSDFTILRLGSDLYICRFKSERDMTLFTLTWS